LLYGYVLDFLNMSCCGIRNPYSFNVADIFIFAGAIGLVFASPREAPPNRG
jgi:signal peptidase II